jgi:hypothetical protein
MDSASEPEERGLVLAQFRSQNQQSRLDLRKLRRTVKRLLSELARRDLTTDDLTSITAIAFEKRKYEQNDLNAALERLQRDVEARANIWDTEALDLLKESVDITASWLLAHRELTDGLLKLAATAAGEVLRARPVKGKVDHAALSREFMARFPKIRAALAK